MKRVLLAIGILVLVGGFVYLATRDPNAPDGAGSRTTLPTDSPAPASGAQPPRTRPATASSNSLSICSFNIQFLGSSKARDNTQLTAILKDFDIVVIQELVAPPYPGSFPDGSPFNPDPEARDFFDKMQAHGFAYLLSDEDTGTAEKNHNNGSATEWWVAFYKPEAVRPAPDLPAGFLAEDRTHNPDFDRVPYAFAFRTPSQTLDFVLIPVHLHPDSGPANRARRKHELAAMAQWIHAHDTQEKDFIILGDMNIEDKAELVDATPQGFLSLNDECRRTNTLHNTAPGGGGKPYDHVLYRTAFTTSELDTQFDLKVIDLIEALRPGWPGPGPYPGDPYNHDEFRKRYSDHDPVEFRMLVTPSDDD